MGNVQEPPAISALPSLSLALVVWKSGSSQLGASAPLRSQKCLCLLGKASGRKRFPSWSVCTDSCGGALRSGRSWFIVLLLESKFLGGCQTPGSCKWQCLPWLQPAHSLFPLGLVGSGAPPEISVCLAVAWGFPVVVVSSIEHLGTLVQISRQGPLPFAHKPQELPLALCAPCGSSCGPGSEVQDRAGPCPQFRGTGRRGCLSPGQRFRIRRGF